MTDLSIRIDSTLIVSMIRALDDVTDRDALRTSAQAHNGEGAKYKGPSGTTDGGGCMADAFC